MSQSVSINMKAEPQVRNLIDRAAKLLHCNRTDFVLEAAIARAEEVILDQQLISLDDEQYQRFIEALDAPPATTPRLRKALERKAPWQ